VISILVVTRQGEDLAALAGRDPSVEILLAQGAEDAVEKLARNRRIDAVLLLAGEEAAGVVSAIREDNPAPPPLFLPEAAPSPLSGIRRLAAEEPGRLIELLAASIEAAAGLSKP